MDAEFVSENQRAEVLLTPYARQLTTGGGKPGQGYPLVLISPSAASSPGSADLTTDSPELGFDTSSSVRAILGGEGCCGSGSLGCRCTTTYETWLSGMGDGSVVGTIKGFGERGWNNSAESADRLVVSISSREGSPAKTCPSPETEPDSQATDPASSTSSPDSQTLFDPDGYSSRTYPDCSPQTAVGTSESCLERWATSGTAWHGGLSTAVTSECRSDAGGCSSSQPSLTEILEPPQNVPDRYSLSARAAQGILRRAHRRGRTLPAHLSAALSAVAKVPPETTSTGAERSS